MRAQIFRTACIIAGILLNLTYLSPALAISRFVATTGTDAGNCANANAPCQTIGFAIGQSVIGDDIQIAAGQYNENNLTLPLGLDLTLNGAGSGLDPAVATIVDGGAADVIFFFNADNVSLSNLTLQNGDGAIFNNGDFLSIDNLLITANNVGNSAIFNNGAGMSITNTQIIDNITTGSGGGIFNNGNDVGLNNVVISGNQSGSSGAGIFNNGENLNLNQVNIDNNRADSSGGGMFNNGNNVTSTFLSLSGNTSGDFGSGGGIFNNGNAFSFTDCAINDNRSDSSGGAMFNNGDDLIFNRCSISGNQITGDMGDGGALFNNGNNTIFLNSTLSNNTAPTIGGALLSNATTETNFVNVTIAGNSDGANGDGIYNNDDTGVILLKNSILANGANGGNCDGPGTFVSLGHNLADDNSCPLGNTGDLPDTNPDLGPLQDNGGNTLTQALLLGSQAIDGVPTADCTDTDDNPITVDQRNLPRPIGAACDIGAFEFSAGVFQFEMANYTVNEDAGIATITVIRTGGFDGDATVDFATSDGTAVAGVNYTATSGTLNFAQNDTSMTFDVPILDDNQSGPDLIANLTLSNPSGGTSLGTPNPATLTIVDQGGSTFVSGGGACALGAAPGTSISLGWILVILPWAGAILSRRR